MAVDNPVYLYLTRRSRWPSEQKSNRLGVIIILIIGFVSILAQLSNNSLAPLLQMFFLSGIAVAVFIPPVVFAVTALATGRDVAGDGYGLLLLSTISDEAIFAGLARTAYHRLRILQILPIAILIGMCPMMASVLYGGSQPGSPTPPLHTIGFSTLFCGPTILAPLILAFVGLYELAIRSGVWLGLRWGRLAPNAAGMLLSVWVILLLPPIFWLAPFLIFIYNPLQGVDVLACLLWPIAVVLMTIVYRLIELAQERAYQVLKRRRAGTTGDGYWRSGIKGLG